MATPNPEKPLKLSPAPPILPNQQQQQAQNQQQPQQQQQLQPHQHPSTLQQDASVRKLMYNSSLAILVACPIIALLPPRKMDFYTFGLGVAWCMSAEYAMEHRTGRGLLWHVSARLSSAKQRERDRELQLAEEREAEARRVAEMDRARMAFRAEEQKRRERERGWFGRMWGGKGGEDVAEDWMEERAEKEREAAEEGRGYGSLIVEQVREAFWGKGEQVDDNDIDQEEKKNG